MRGKIVQKHGLLLNRIFPARGARTVLSFRVKAARFGCQRYRVSRPARRHEHRRVSEPADGGRQARATGGRRYFFGSQVAFGVEAASKRRCASLRGGELRPARPIGSRSNMAKTAIRKDRRPLRPAAQPLGGVGARPNRVVAGLSDRRVRRRPSDSSSRRCCVFCRLPLSSA